VLPEYQGKGIGSALITYTKTLAKDLGYRAIIIYGDVAYYSRFGFKEAELYGITDKEGRFSSYLLALELYETALEGIHGTFDEGEHYTVNEDELAEFEKGFAAKEKGAPKKPL
jgi:predicted N-acetyltransferase YhbS